MIIALAAWLACNAWTPPEPARPPGLALTDVSVALDDAVDRAKRGDPAALESWHRAHRYFSKELEPRLRASHDRATVAGVEYQFSVIHRRLTEGGGDVEAAALSARLAELLGVTLPREPSPSP